MQEYLFKVNLDNPLFCFKSTIKFLFNLGFYSDFRVRAEIESKLLARLQL